MLARGKNNPAERRAVSERRSAFIRSTRNGQSHQVPQVDAETEDEVDSSDIVKGYEVGKGQYTPYEVIC